MCVSQNVRVMIGMVKDFKKTQKLVTKKQSTSDSTITINSWGK